MSFLRIITIIIFIFIGVTIYGILHQNILLLTLGHLFLLPLVGLWYGVKRMWAFELTDIYIYTAFLLGSFADSVILIDWGKTGEFLSISFSLVMNFLIVMVFRKEGTRIYSEKLKDIPKIAIPVLMIFLFFGYVLMPSVPSSIYVVTILYAILEVILVAHGFFRTAKGKSYVWVSIGVSAVLLKDALFSFHFFIYNNTKIYLYAVQYPLNILAYFMIIIGISINLNKEFLVKETIWQYIKNHIKLLFNFNHLSHFNRSLIFWKKSLTLKTLRLKRNFSALWLVLIKKNKVYLDELE